jgi:cystathionine beta-lyase family protein involved in aluminum resistance
MLDFRRVVKNRKIQPEAAFCPTKNQGLEWMNSNPRMQIALFLAGNFLRNITGVRDDNQQRRPAGKADEVTNKTARQLTVDTIFSGTGFTPLQWVAMEQGTFMTPTSSDKAQKTHPPSPEQDLAAVFIPQVKKWMCLQVNELLTLRGKLLSSSRILFCD